jgi:Holliday junction resolvasome RuvABC ATP-dependent DNA helicase subunit
MNRTNVSTKWILQLAEAGLTGDHQKSQSAIASAIKKLRGDSPELAKALADLLAQHTANPKSLHWGSAGPPPADSEEGMALVRLFRTDDAAAPVLSRSLSVKIRQFLQERKDSSKLFHEGLAPAASILLIGEPGTGKTMLARWLASELELPFLVQDLATSISSLLGKTGLNLRRTLDYARNRPCVLLLDEFDAIAKRRDDTTELGELKRIVNVLLKELEEWPTHSVLIAATNHPTLLDAAIARRFHMVLSISLPEETERLEILQRVAGRFKSELPEKLLHVCAKNLAGKSGSALESLMSVAIRRHVVTGDPFIGCFAEEMAAELELSPKKNKSAFAALLRELHSQGRSSAFTVRDLAGMFDKSVSTIQYHLTKDPRHG